MNEDDNVRSLIVAAARQHGVEPILLEQLLALELTFTNFSIHGAKADFARRVSYVIETAAGQGGM